MIRNHFGSTYSSASFSILLIFNVFLFKKQMGGMQVSTHTRTRIIDWGQRKKEKMNALPVRRQKKTLTATIIIIIIKWRRPIDSHKWERNEFHLSFYARWYAHVPALRMRAIFYRDAWVFSVRFLSSPFVCFRFVPFVCQLIICSECIILCGVAAEW